VNVFLFTEKRPQNNHVLCGFNDVLEGRHQFGTVFQSSPRNHNTGLCRNGILRNIVAQEGCLGTASKVFFGDFQEFRLYVNSGIIDVKVFEAVVGVTGPTTNVEKSYNRLERELENSARLFQPGQLRMLATQSLDIKVQKRLPGDFWEGH